MIYDERSTSSPSAHSSARHTVAFDDAESVIPSKINRTRTGCRTSRSRKVKCSEEKPVCAQCQRANRTCEWSAIQDKRRSITRRANATACNACRAKKLRCVGSVETSCEKCSTSGIVCVRQRDSRASSALSPLQGQLAAETTARCANSSTALSHGTPYLEANSHMEDSEVIEEQTSLLDSPSTNATASPAARALHESNRSGDLPEGEELKALVDLYFTSVHHFGYFAFVHELHFKRLLRNGRAPRELTLMMIANAMRFAEKVTPENLAKDDSWAD
ncbi:uncharacterized protein PV09_02375 [Verruconis gallopava]|uniref:Zn(2)-C6 fungal-type domain-containing protein n=1 Tax=Verruconis gallopava TaxID=253628 RepID=A0A0D2B607_9PEZI|nr:uncharacterized protein PV09_02375 [Verruconis gallopava]KIW06669.1 hypothetical protein PV09_02375 [Verruconis gallopava]